MRHTQAGRLAACSAGCVRAAYQLIATACRARPCCATAGRGHSSDDKFKWLRLNGEPENAYRNATHALCACGASMCKCSLSIIKSSHSIQA